MKVLIFSCYFLLLPLSGMGKDWRGLVPLQSTRADVIALLGPSTESNEIRSIYKLETEEVFIVFSHYDELMDTCVNRLPKGLVMMIQVKPKKELSLADIGIDPNKCEQFDPTQPGNLGYWGYLDKTAGIVIRTRTEKKLIDQINYFASAKETIKCADYYDNPKTFILMRFHFR